MHLSMPSHLRSLARCVKPGVPIAAEHTVPTVQIHFRRRHGTVFRVLRLAGTCAGDAAEPCLRSCDHVGLKVERISYCVDTSAKKSPQ
jgi:hypothetical protein